MANLKEVKNRIGSVVSTQQITKAMKMVAAAKLRRAQDRIIQLRPYAEKLSAILQNVSSDVDESLVNEYAIERDVEKVLLVVITSDRGLCGAFNSNVFKHVTSLIEKNYSQQQANGNLRLLTIGRRGHEYFSKRGYKVIGDFSELFSELSFNEVRKAAEYAMEGFRAGDFDKVEVVYNEFKNVATQILRTEQFLPIKPVEEEEQKVENIDYIYEPDKAFIIKELIPKSLKIQFFKTLLESNASEHGARMTAMDKATENAGELLKELRLTYNRTRQAAITTEILEIVAGAEALSSGR
ncbi:ATP synthase F1 subunit gamma [Xanthovirga aplysinae]|uniref:ATP synthase F1 subunit gamma n=1 Tax=Xanthovirga aplysinae TaxID=2529853 RepID=UPI0012BC3CDE|nr:ATP synthase F1 subunit gamma [Xanthovirga aplysinae]MTI31929.1 ATP synthase F1 subunit gamma [Xanthovirga aplysinae]